MQIHFSRREFLKASGLTALAALSASVLTGCSDTDDGVDAPLPAVTFSPLFSFDHADAAFVEIGCELATDRITDVTVWVQNTGAEPLTLFLEDFQVWLNVQHPVELSWLSSGTRFGSTLTIPAGQSRQFTVCLSDEDPVFAKEMKQLIVSITIDGIMESAIGTRSDLSFY